jgi:hypothetical protein
MCQNFTLTVSTVIFSYELCFAPGIVYWISLSKLFYLSCTDIVYLGSLFRHGF